MALSKRFPKISICVGNVTATLNGQPIANGQVVGLARMAGGNTLAVTAEDLAGNVTAQSVTFDVSIAASVDLNPGTLNKKSGGGANSMTAYIELPSGYDPSLIQAASKADEDCGEEDVASSAAVGRRDVAYAA